MPQFNKGQLKAIHHIDGPMLALAGPGSGKTTAMVHRIKYLIEEAGVSPNNILVITFTRAAAREMEGRFISLMSDAEINGRNQQGDMHKNRTANDSDNKKRSLTSRPTFGTFHSVFFYILKVAYGYNSGDIFTEDEKYSLIRELLRNKELEYDDEDDVVTDIIGEISLVKGEMINIDNYYSSSVGEEVFREIYREYHNIVSGRGKIDFDDMMVYCYELLSEREDILKNLQARYRYILVDEFQDINRIQYEITRMLSAPEDNLFAVGDDDQSIYGFRGAKPEIMLKFKEDYPDVNMTLLDINYRCNRNIVESAARLIANNSTRYEKQLVSAYDYEEPVHIHHMQGRNEENTHIIEKIREYKDNGISYNEMSIIYRTNAQAGSIVHRLSEYNIPFYIRDKVPCIYDHFIVKTVMDYVEAALGNRDRQLFLRIINKPNRYISREILDEETVSFDKLLNKLKNKDWIADRVEQLSYDIEMIAKLKPYATVNFIRKSIGYDDYLQEYANYRHFNVDDLYDLLDELAESAKQYKTHEDWFAGIAAYREELNAHSRSNVNQDRDGVAVTTMHSAKGLEYEVVFIPEANEGLAPYKKAVLPENIEEERRMFYVAMTRARHHLHIYSVKRYFNRELEPSRFITEIVG